MEITPLIGGVGKHFGPIEFKADRPFLFYLIDRDNNNIPLIMGRVHNPQPQHVNQLKHQANGKPEPIRPPFKSGNNLPKANTGRPEFQSTSISHPTSSIPEDDQVIYPQAPSLSNYYKAIQQITNRYFPNSPSIKNLHTPITFLDEEFDGRRLKRESGNASAISPMSSTSDEDKNVDIRLKDSLWFNKPTAPEVIIPISMHPNQETNRPSESSIPTYDKPTASLLSQTVPEEQTTTTGPPLSSTTPPNIFHALTPSPYPSPVFPVNNINNIWNPNIEQNVGGQAPGFPPNPPIGPNGRPVLIPPPPWHQTQPNPYFQSLPPYGIPYNQFPPGSGYSGIFFPQN